MRASNRDASRGFTLVELLIGLLVLSAVSASFWHFFATSTRIQAHQSDYLESMAEVLKVWRVLQEDLRCNALPPGSRGPIRPLPEVPPSFELPEAQDPVAFGELPRKVVLVLMKDSPSAAKPESKSWLGTSAEVRHGSWVKQWRFDPIRGWLHNDWPDWFNASDDDLPEFGTIDGGENFHLLPLYEDVVERISTQPRVSDDPASCSTVLGLTTTRGEVYWIWHPVTKDGQRVRRLLRMFANGDGAVMSAGLLTAFDVQPVLELVPHPGNDKRGADVRKLMFQVHLEAKSELGGRVLDARPFTLDTLVYPVQTLKLPFVRWLPAR